MLSEAAMPLLVGVAGLVVVQRLVELRVARRNERWLRDQGAVEFGAGHYPLFFVLHIGWLLAWPLEAWLDGPRLSGIWGAALVLALGAQVLRYLAIVTLGRRWNTRILVLPGRAPVAHGVYRWLRHPNYLAVVIELLCIPLIFGAFWTASVVSLLNLALLGLVRVPAEERALAGE